MAVPNPTRPRKRRAAKTGASKAATPKAVARKAGAAKAGGARERLLSALGAAVRARRAGLGFSRQALAKAASLSERFLAQLESGRGNISVGKLDALARALGMPASALLAAGDLDWPFSSNGDGLALLAEVTTRLQRVGPEQWRGLLRHLDGGPPASGTESSRLIALLGLRGAGKSTLGPLLARRLGIPFHEMDELIVEQSGLALNDIFALHGETYYREAERRAVHDLIGRGERAVIAVSGGIVTDPEALELLKRHTLMVWLRAEPEQYMARVEAQGDYRPMRNRPNAMAELKALLRERTPLYRQARVSLETGELSPEAATERLESLVHQAGWAG
jgi:XRE family aerobic/anaerobic benzoate catabolism transcriptional regulator